MATVTDEERFLFDLQGFLIVKGVLSDAELRVLNAAVDEKFDEYAKPSEHWRPHRCSHWGQPFVDLIDHDGLMPYLPELLGPWFRIDHDYCIFMRSGDALGGLHGGSHLRHSWGDHWYRYQDGLMRNGLTVFSFLLTDAAEGDGGFACVPGSHKSNFLDLLPPDVRNYERPASYVLQPAVAAGDVLIFTEALVHGTMPWTADHERRALLYKYSPGHSAWDRDGYDLADYRSFHLTRRRRRIMQPPHVGGHQPVLEGG